MAFITIFTAPKPFSQPHIRLIQRNALRSWLALGAEVEVFLVGAESGMAEVAAEFGVRQLGDVERNEQGTPLVSSIFSLARQSSQSPLLAYLNADIMTLPDFLATARQVSAQVQQFLILGRRWDLDVRQELEFGTGWAGRLEQDIAQRGRLHRPAGSDYFIFPRALFAEMPAFAIGRAGWDNWMIYRAREQGWPVVDVTPEMKVIHQDHDYSHLPGGQPHYKLPETDRNVALAGGQHHMYTILDADRELRGGKLQAPRPTLLRWLRGLELRLTPPDGARRGARYALARQARRLRRRLTGSL
jgi:hypothetical protein